MVLTFIVGQVTVNSIIPAPSTLALPVLVLVLVLLLVLLLLLLLTTFLLSQMYSLRSSIGKAKRPSTIYKDGAYYQTKIKVV